MIALQKWFDEDGTIRDIPEQEETFPNCPWDSGEFQSLIEALMAILPPTAMAATKAIRAAGAVGPGVRPMFSALILYHIKAERIDVSLDVLYPVKSWECDPCHIHFQKTCQMWNGFPLEPEVTYLLHRQAMEKYGNDYLSYLNTQFQTAIKQAEGGLPGTPFALDMIFGVRV